MSPDPHVNLVECNGEIIDIKNQNIHQKLDDIIDILQEEENIKIKSLLVLVEK
ncbi:hypothetical protein MBMB1_1631 [Methanobacterium sp. MB1]|nr:hypothetical protein MBMB1_1631 [Methanobacterium sp. MB1]